MRDEKTLHGIRLAALAACALLSLAGVSLAQQASTTYRGAPRDPFEQRKAVVKKVKPGPKLVEPPPVEARIQSYKAHKAAAMSAQLPAPKPTMAFLLSELEVRGIFRTPRGWAAMVEAKPIKLSYTVYPGEVFYNGMLVAIEEERLVFRRESRWSDGRRETTVELKALAQPNAVKDSMTTATVNNAATAPAAAQALPNQGGALTSDALMKMVEELSRKLVSTPGASAGADPNSPEVKSLLERLKGSVKPK